MTDTKDLRVRAETCVECHVGSERCEVNHDLIAAGHPRLRFEYGAYLANYPKHWNDAEDRAGRPDFEARAWSIGQVVSARAALELLQSRAAGEKKPWPEFAEYGCFSCHHNLQDRRWRQPAPGGLSLLPVLAGRQPPPQPLELESLEKQMSRTVPDREEVAREAGRVAKLMTGWLKQVAKPPQGEKTLPNLLTALARERPESTSNWDNATQLYLALAAVDQALGEVEGKYRDQPPARAALKDLHDALDRAFPRDQESAYDSPRDYDPTEIDKILGKLREQLRGLGLE
jgi:hypothetical protein